MRKTDDLYKAVYTACPQVTTLPTTAHYLGNATILTSSVYIFRLNILERKAIVLHILLLLCTQYFLYDWNTLSF